eukprot:scaffold79770_cov70-Phaeocystis_antarctica.AAC.1
MPSDLTPSHARGARARCAPTTTRGKRQPKKQRKRARPSDVTRIGATAVRPYAEARTGSASSLRRFHGGVNGSLYCSSSGGSPG